MSTPLALISIMVLNNKSNFTFVASLCCE